MRRLPRIGQRSTRGMGQPSNAELAHLLSVTAFFTKPQNFLGFYDEHVIAFHHHNGGSF